MPGTNARLTRNAVVRFRSISARHSSRVSWATGRSISGLALLASPALLTITSTGPSCSAIASASAPTSASTVRSATKPVTPSSPARSWIRRVVDTMATSAPSATSRRAVAYPMPSGLPAPVTRATLPSRRSAAVVVVGVAVRWVAAGVAGSVVMRPILPGPGKSGNHRCRASTTCGTPVPWPHLIKDT